MSESDSHDPDEWIADEVRFWREALHRASLSEPVGVLRRMHEALQEAERREALREPGRLARRRMQ